MNLTTNTTSAAIAWPGGVGTFFAQGTFDSATLKLQFSKDGGTTKTDLDGLSMTAAGAINFELGPCDLYFVTSGGGGLMDINAEVNRIES